MRSSTMKKIDGSKIGTYEAIITIIWDDFNSDTPKVKKVYHTTNGTADDKFISLNDCMEIINFDGKGLITVIIDNPLCGIIYQYGNYTNGGWYEYGTTKGYA